MKIIKKDEIFTYGFRKYKALRDISFTDCINQTDITYYLTRRYIEDLGGELVNMMKKGEKFVAFGKTYVANITLEGYSLTKANSDLTTLLDKGIITLAEPKMYVIYREDKQTGDKIFVKMAIHVSNEELKKDLKGMYENLVSAIGLRRASRFTAEMVESIDGYDVVLEEQPKHRNVGTTACGNMGGFSNRNIPF